MGVGGRVAKLNRDRRTIHALHAKNWKAWLGDVGGAKDGGLDDPRIVLIEVDAREATYMKSNTPSVVALFKVVKGIATGDPPKLGDMRDVERDSSSTRAPNVPWSNGTKVAPCGATFVRYSTSPRSPCCVSRMDS